MLAPHSINHQIIQIPKEADRVLTGNKTMVGAFSCISNGYSINPYDHFQPPQPSTISRHPF